MIKVEFNNEYGYKVEKKQVEKIAELASKMEKKIKGSIEINVVNKKIIKKLNKEFRGKNKETDVLSFSLLETNSWGNDLIGQIFICFPKIQIQANDFGVTEKEEFARMLIHGLLHVVGYDHMLKKEAAKMFGLQEKILEKAKQKKLA
jgi:probable rRNA maturation factor